MEGILQDRTTYRHHKAHIPLFVFSETGIHTYRVFAEKKKEKKKEKKRRFARIG